MSEVEKREGQRWARGICLSMRETFKDWRASLLKTLEWGLVEKPEDYKVGVQQYIDLVRSVPDTPVAVESDDEVTP